MGKRFYNRCADCGRKGYGKRHAHRIIRRALNRAAKKID